MNNDWLVRTLMQWKNEGIQLNPPATVEAIAFAEAKMSFSFPIGFKQLYLAADGFAGDNWRENMFTVWPIERILYEFIARKDDAFIGFSDFLLNCHAIGFYKDLHGIYKDADKHFPIAQTFEECIVLINSDDPGIY